MSGVAATFCILLLNAMPAAGLAATVNDQATIRDIRGPLPPDGLPPFAGVGLVMLVASLGLVASRASRKRNPAEGLPPAPALSADKLSHLRDAYERGELSADQLFGQLSRQIGEGLVPDATTTMTSTEILNAADGMVPAETIRQAAVLLMLCDRVRFSTYRPAAAVVAEALAAAQKLLDRMPAGVP